ncbi:hypothetical protein DL93DRAFT_496014 [Clavulina sp. PMI_390]|nr:hypothetical protein DL93DRAFT_496014 [Clavulina sp. PMI_390]
MLVQQSLWDAIDTAHNALHRSITSILREPSFTQTQHVLALIPSERERASTTIKGRKGQVSDCKHRLEIAQQTLKELETLCTSVENGLDMCLQPIGGLPQELVQHIVYFAVESPRKARQIMTLSQVSRAWRDAVFTMPRLFVSPDWGWAPNVLQSWLARAGTRPLHPYIALTDSDSESLLDKLSKAVTPQLQRVQTLHIEVQGYFDSGFPSSFSELFQRHPLPLVETLIITGKGPGRISIDTDQSPRLRTLHSSGIPIALLPEGKHNLNSLGWRVQTIEDTKLLANAAASQTVPFHLTIYAHPSEVIDSSLMIEPESRTADCWRNVISLRLHGFCGRDSEQIGSLISQLEMPNLVSLELIELSYEVFSILVETMPLVTSRRVENLLMACVERTTVSPKNFFGPLSDTKRRKNTELPFPNLAQFALRDFLSEERCDWSNDFDSIKTFVEARRGILKQLILPTRFRPVAPPPDLQPQASSETDSDSPPRPPPAPKEALTFGQEASLLEAGGVKEVLYDFTIDHHGFDVKPPRYF